MIVFLALPNARLTRNVLAWLFALFAKTMTTKHCRCLGACYINTLNTHRKTEPSSFCKFDLFDLLYLYMSNQKYHLDMTLAPLRYIHRLATRQRHTF